MPTKNVPKRIFLTIPSPPSSRPAVLLPPFSPFLHQQVRALDQSPDHDRWTKWLGPTVNVICTLSDGLGEGVGLVILRLDLVRYMPLIYIWQVFSPAKPIFVAVGVLLSVRTFDISVRPIYQRLTSHRQLRMFGEVKIRLSIPWSASKAFSDVLKFTRKCGRLRK
jgi:hypothetical protein